MPTNRETLKIYFQKGAKPTAEQFAALIDSGLNQAEDGVTLANKSVNVDGSMKVIGTIVTATLRTNSLSVETETATFKRGVSVVGSLASSSLSITGAASVAGGLTSTGLTVNKAPAPGVSGRPGSEFWERPTGGVGRPPTPNEPQPPALTVNGDSTTSGVATFTSGIKVTGGVAVTGGVTVTGGAITISPAVGSVGDGFFGPGAVPIGGIIMWSGIIAAIPQGWALCDGNKGTPNLSGRFVMAAGNSSSPGTSGGSQSATITLAEANLPPHSHEYTDETRSTLQVDWQGDAKKSPIGGSLVESKKRITEKTPMNPATPFTVPTIPPYYVLAFIMRVAL